MVEKTRKNKKATPYVDPLTRKYEPYKPVYVDPLTRKYESYKYVYVDPLTRKYEPYRYVYVDPLTRSYPTFKPKYVGVYNEKEQQRKVRPRRQPRKPAKKPRITIRTYQCYRFPMGPDIKVGDIGPDYKARPYREIKFKPLTPLKFDCVYKDTLPGRKIELYRPVEIPKTTNLEYKLTEENYLPFRYWKIGDITDTVALGHDFSPKTNRTKQSPASAFPVLQRPKTFMTSSTQYSMPLTKNAVTQTDVTSKVSVTQTTPLPPVNLVPVADVRKSQKTAVTQYSPPETPIISGISKKDTRTSTPAVPVSAPLTGSVPKVRSQVQTAEYIGFQNGKRRTALPPEINAYIEAYDVVRMVDMAEDAISSIKRTLRFM